MQIDFEQLEALFNICLQYRKLGNFTAEIQCLKLLKEVRDENVISKMTELIIEKIWKDLKTNEFTPSFNCK